MAMFDDLKQGLAEVDAFLSGEHTGAKVTIPAQVDVKIIRKRLNMTRTKVCVRVRLQPRHNKTLGGGKKESGRPGARAAYSHFKKPQSCALGIASRKAQAQEGVLVVGIQSLQGRGYGSRFIHMSIGKRATHHVFRANKSVMSSGCSAALVH